MPKADVGSSLQPTAGTQEIRKIRRIARVLEEEYGFKVWKRGDDVLSQLIKTILSQNTTDANSLRAFHSLRERFPTWSQVNKAAMHEVADAIWSGGLARIKARRIKDILAQICRKYPHCDLSFLSGWPTERIKVFLEEFTGVGDKTIACVLLFALNRPVMPVDTHILRVCQRLGWIPLKTGAKKAHQLLQAMIPQNLVYALHLNLIEHGRKTCKARNPRCDRCGLRSACLVYPAFRAEHRREKEPMGA